MKEHYDRRKFLKASILGAGAFFAAISPLKSFARSIPADRPPLSAPDADLLYRQAKDLFYRKEYTQAARLYGQLIEAFPDRYVYYDGYARVLGAEQKTLEAAELYREGLLKNPQHPYFMQRLALRIYDLCLGSRKAEQEFCRKYGGGVLLETAAGLLLDAIALKPGNKGFYLSLRDVLRAAEQKNLHLEQRNLPRTAFSPALTRQIMAASSGVEVQWARSRASRKPALPEDTDRQLEKINSRRRRRFYNEKEQKAFEKTMHKARKSCKKQGMESGLKLNNAARVERCAMLVLEESVHDTDTVGKLRKYYRKTKNYDKIITLNRYLYSKEPSAAHRLALARSLTRSGKNAKDFNEAKKLLQPISSYIDTLGPVYSTTYYICNAEAYAATGGPKTAQEFLLQALLQFDGNLGKTYVFLEKYAVVSHTGKKKSLGMDLLKTLACRDFLAVDKKQRTEKDDPVWQAVDKYIDSIQKQPVSLPEQLKPLNALLKLQQGKGREYRKIEDEIKGIKEQIINSKV